MSTYKYKVRDKSGKAINGVMEAPDYDTVAAKLDKSGYIPVSIQEKKDVISFNIFNPRISIDDLILFSRQLSAQVGAGIPLLAGLYALSEQAEDKRMKAVINKISTDIEEGTSLSDAMARHPKVFSSLYVSMIKAGEAAGTLDKILDRLSALTEYEKDIRARINAATRYPKIVLTAITSAFIVLITFVIPRFASIFSKFGETLPLPTRIMIGINHLFHQYWYIGIVATVSIALGFHWYINTGPGRLRWDNFKIRVPMFGTLFLKIAISRFSYIFGMLIRSGIPILQTLKITSETVGNTFISQKLKKLMESVEEGSGISGPLKEAGVFTPMVVQMVSVGEQSGKLDDMMVKVAQYYDLDVEYTINKLSTFIEPILIVAIGGMVLFMALAIFLPMWDMTTLLKR
ncbi:MAG: type II secretion system F family protein [Thermodesulfobacteriota bacterium]|nr:type II secretion system F family protein [Thermodesulfobacteriota bacterium]